MVGSFLNVCIYRLPRGYLSIVAPRSHCPHCGKLIQWFDNLPVLSWTLLAGACRHCRSPIRFRYTFVELLTAALFGFAAYQVFFNVQLAFPHLALTDSLELHWVMTAVMFYLLGHLIVITFIDLDYRIIPDGLTYPGIVLAPLFSTLYPMLLLRLTSADIPAGIGDIHLAGFLASILGILVGGGSLYLVGVIGKVLFQKDAMGFGDVKMMAMVGGFLGWDAALLIFFLACVLGTVIGIFWLLVTRDHYLPFGPYLAMGAWVVLFYKEDIIRFITVVWPRLISNLVGLPFTY